jgi:CubicO group peptidase (beta-lactamase class C family)
VNTTTSATLLAAVIGLGFPVPGLTHHAADFERLHRQIDELRSDASVPGAALVIVDRDGIILADAFGTVDNESGLPVTPDTVFRIGSVTKIFTAAALVQLARRDDFSLDDPVSRHVPAGLFFNEWEDEHPVTVANLLEHTSGFRDWTKAEFDYNIPVDLEDGLAFSPRSRTSRWQPGLHSVYSNSNYGLAGLVLERVSGQSYEALIRESLFAPLEMHSATSLQARTNNLATGYDRDGVTPIPYWHMIQRPAAAINATPREMAALVSMLLNNGSYREQSVLTPAEIARIESPRTSLAARHGLRFGYGLGIYTQYRNGFEFMGHGGDGDGYLSRFGYCRQLDVGYFVVINSFNPQALGRLRRAIESSLTRGHRPPPSPPTASPGKDRLHHYSGKYALAARRFDWQTGEESPRTLMIEATDDGRLFTRDHAGKREPLIAVTRHEFRRTGDGGATSGFYEEAGRLYFQENDNWVKVEALTCNECVDTAPLQSSATAQDTAK